LDILKFSFTASVINSSLNIFDYRHPSKFAPPRIKISLLEHSASRFHLELGINPYYDNDSHYIRTKFSRTISDNAQSFANW